MQIIVWTKSNCVQCDQTKKQLDRVGIRYEEKSLEEDFEQLEIFKEQGLLQAPIVQAGESTWTGFRMDYIKSLQHIFFGDKIV